VTQGQQTLAAIMLTDAVGFSARMSVNEELTLELIRRDQKIMASLCKQHEGRVLKSTGDGLLMAFSSAAQAVNCGLKIQRELHNRNQGFDAEKALLHRIGIHLGDVYFSESDVMGNGVNIADRLQAEAEPGGLCISQIVYDVVKSRLSLEADYAGPLNLKNIRDPVPAYRLHALPQDRRSGSAPGADSLPDMVQSSNGKLSQGTRVGGRYILQRVLGQGGFGRSYLAEDTQRFNEFCVVKEFFPTKNSGRSLQKAVDLFKREAKTLYQMDHPQIPKFLACFTQAQRLFLVQEFIDGISYSQLLHQRRREARGFTETEVREWLVPMLQVLDYIHGLNVVHRDISPDNIMYCRDRNLPVLIDFGLVNDAVSNLLNGSDSEADSGTTIEDSKPATMVGKFGYSPPEQMHLGQCFPCSDLYALGVTAIVFLTGKYPRDLINRDSLEWHWQDYANPSPELVTILNGLIRQKPKERYQTAREVLGALQPSVTLQSPTVSEEPCPQPIAPPAGTVLTPLPDSGLGASPSGPVDEEFLDQCRRELTRCIGPMASYVLEDAMDQHPTATATELVEIIAAQLSDGDQATAFVSRLSTASQISAHPISEADSEISQGPPSRTAEGTTGPGKISATPLTPEFIAQCRQALTRCIGPMATMVLEDVIESYPNLDPEGFVTKLAQEIPDDNQAKAFRQQLL
jgi:serine/threonine protein kinase/class 3 adenylate cyclase